MTTQLEVVEDPPAVDHDEARLTPSPAPSPSRSVLVGLAPLVGPVTAAVCASVLATAAPVGVALAVFACLLAGNLLAAREPAWGHLLPLMGLVSKLTAPAIGLVLLAIPLADGHLAGVTPVDALFLAAGSAILTVLARGIARRLTADERRRRIVVIGSGRAADSLQRELLLSGESDLSVVGRVSTSGAGSLAGTGDVPLLGPLHQIGEIVEEHAVDLLLMTSDAPRMEVFDEVARSCLGRPVRLRELAGFYEETFGHVAAGEINAAWFQHLMHPKYRHDRSVAERVIDVVVAGLAGLAALPVLAVLALIIRRDGGPVFFRQVRIGEGGKPFTIIKLRTMRMGADSGWAQADDDRVTKIGRVLRRTHLDELPQVLNVLRGEMSVVGPRPEQPSFVDRLEQQVPFYQRRHLIKPGMTGWAQVRCGYAGSEIGSAWKVCHDLYYLKHRSAWLNLVILGETVRTLVADPQYTAEPATVDFILAPVPTPLDVRVPA